jgi:hypothetical protein
MKINYIRILKGCIALVITVACLYIGQALWQNYAVDLPLGNALNGIDGIETVTWENSNSVNDTVNIGVILKNTENIKKTYDEMNNKIQQTLKGRPYTLEIDDNRSPELEQTYYDLHYYIQKAIVDGDFPLLEEKVQEKAKFAGISAKLYVDEQNIYLQMVKDSSSLYSVTARNIDKIGGNL